ncbi:MAG: hypothetical protein AAGJ87_13380 [Pseudomonadota bacterium]
MSALENAVQVLADALDKLEGNLDDHIADANADEDAIVAARREAQTARARVSEASDAVAAAIAEVKSLLAAPSANDKREA